MEVKRLQHILFRSVCLLFFVLCFWPTVSQAARLNDFELWPSLQEIGKGSDYTAYFVSPSGTQDSGDTIMLTFGDAFDFGGWGYPPQAPRDVDIAYDDDGVCNGPWTDIDLADTADATNWGAAITGNVLTFSPSTTTVNATIPTNRCIQIELGHNATYQETGIGQLKNPSTSASVSLAVSGGFGDSNTLATNMVADAVMNITASVYAPPTYSHRQVDGPTSREHLMITGEQAVYDGQDIVVDWDTNFPANSKIEYWIDGEEASPILLEEAAFVRARTIRIPDVELGQLYFLRLHSRMPTRQSAQTDILSVLTVDDQNSVFIDLEVRELLPHNMRGRLRSSIPLSGKFYAYTLEPTAHLRPLMTIPLFSDRTFLQRTAAQNWPVQFSDLYDDVRYALIGTLHDSLGNMYKAYTEFVTPVDLPPANVRLATYADAEHILLRWATPPEVDMGDVIVVMRTDRYAQQPDDGQLLHAGLGHMLEIDRVTPEGVFLTVFTRDLVGQLSSGVRIWVPPQAEDVQLRHSRNLNVAYFYANEEEPSRAQLVWDGPTDNRAHYRVIRRSDRPALNAWDGSVLWDTQESSYLDTTLLYRGEYFYTVFTSLGDTWDGGVTTQLTILDPSMRTSAVLSPMQYAHASSELTPTTSLADSLYRIAAVFRDTVKQDDASLWQVRTQTLDPLQQVGGHVQVLPGTQVFIGHSEASSMEEPELGSFVLTSMDRAPDRHKYAGLQFDTWGKTHTFTLEDESTLAVDVVAPGQITWGEDVSVARILLEERVDGDWRPVTGLMQDNPQVTTGAFGWHVPENGTYRVRAEASGYVTETQRVWVGENGIVKPQIKLLSVETSLLKQLLGWSGWVTLTLILFLLIIIVSSLHRKQEKLARYS